MPTEHSFRIYGKDYQVEEGDIIMIEDDNGFLERSKVQIIDVDQSSELDPAFEVKIIPPDNSAEQLMEYREFGPSQMADCIEAAANSDRFINPIDSNIKHDRRLDKSKI